MTAPQTPFELSGRTAWTPLEDEQAYVDSLLAYAGPRLQYEVVGQSVEGRPIRLFRIGTGPRKVLFTSQIHGDEPASREVMYTMLQRWLDTSDPALKAYLRQATVLVMPTCSPDTLTSRLGKSGVNVNRDFLNLAAPETRAIASVVRRERPELVVDWHEFHATYADYSPATPTNPNAAAGVVALSTGLYEAAFGAVADAGWRVQQYNVESGPDWHINNTLMHGAVTVLMETSTMIEPWKRHDMHLLNTETIWRWHAAHLNEVSAAVGAARAALPSLSPVTIKMGFDAAPPIVNPVPNGYALTLAEWGRLAPQREAYGITGHQAASGYYVPTAQSTRPLLVYLMDPSSPVRVVSGEPMDAPPVSPPPMPIGRDVSYFYRRGGRTLPATLKVKA